MNKEELLLEEAKRRYPIGTVFNSAANPNSKNLTVNNIPKWNYDQRSIGTKDNGDNGIVYSKDGKWAEIISLPSEYLVGTSVKVVLDSMNASQFNTEDCPAVGVYSISSWRTTIFTICGEHKLYKGYEGYEDEYQNCYPLAHNEKLVGYVYSKGLAPYKEEFKLPKVWHIAVTEESKSTLEKWRTDGSICFTGGYCLSEKHPAAPQYHNSKKGYKVTNAPSNSTEITFEQFKKYVLNINETKNSVMKTFPITRTQFQYIYDVACSGWKSKINTMVQEKLGTFGTSCELSYEVVESMFKAATTEQTKTLVKIFPDYSTDKSVNLFEKRDDTLFTRELSLDGMINIRSGGDYNGKAFYLSAKFKWELKRDDYGGLCLIPTLK